MTYNLTSDTTMIVTDMSNGNFVPDLVTVFYRNGEEIPVSEVIPTAKEIEIYENYDIFGYTLTLLDTDGKVISIDFMDLEGIAAHLALLASEAETVTA